MQSTRTLTDSQLRAAELNARRLRSEAVREMASNAVAWLRGLFNGGASTKGGRTA